MLESGTNELEVVEFYLNQQNPDGSVYKGHYGINVSKVLSIINKPEVDVFPGTKGTSIAGFFNLRNQVIPLIDLSLHLNINAPKDENKKVIITYFNSVTNGFLVSDINRIQRLSWESISSADDSMRGFNSDDITGIINFDDRITILLDFEKIIADINPDIGVKAEKIDQIISQDKKYTALIVDDSNMIRQMMKDILERSGFKVLSAENGQKGWEMLETMVDEATKNELEIHDVLQIVVSDIEMPKMDGFTLTHNVKKDPRFENIPVMLFSSLASESLKHKGDSVGADDWISKPELGLLATKALNLLEAKSK